MATWKRLSTKARSDILAAVFVLTTVLLVMLITQVAREVSYKSKCATVKQNLHTIQLAVERYSVDDPESAYPSDLRELISTGYMTGFPLNPFTNQPMREVTDPADAQRGDFIYNQLGKRGNPPAPGEKPTGYTLDAYF